MREVHVTDLRNHLPAYLAEVQGGEELRVLSRGKVIARIVPEVGPSAGNWVGADVVMWRWTPFDMQRASSRANRPASVLC